MTTTRSHANCDHPRTSAGRAKCRKIHAERVVVLNRELDQVINSYYNNSAEAEEIISQLLIMADSIPALKPAIEGYYNNDLEMEEIMGIVLEARQTI